MSAIAPDLDALGARLAFVGNGKPHFARAFRDEQGITAPLYVAPDLAAYEAFGFEQGVGSTFAPGSVVHAARALLGGHRQGAVMGAPFQQGGIALVLPDGSVQYLYRSREAGDHPSTAEVLAAVKAALGGVQPSVGP